MSPETATLDALERKIVRCIHLSPRVPFRTVADVLDVSEQTVARRYRRLVRTGLLHVTALVRPAAMGQQNWMVRIHVRPSGAESLASALAERDDVSWVILVSGGSEVICVLRARTSEARDDLLMKRLPRSTPVLGMSASMVIHRFVGVGDARRDEAGLGRELDAAQEAVVLATATRPPPEDRRFAMLPEDHVIASRLAEDGRTPYAQLASAAGVSQTRAARRVEAMVEGGALYFDVDVSVSAMGMQSLASLWLTVSPSELDAAGRALAAEGEIAFAGAITGPSNIAASLVCRDVEHLYRFVTDKVGRIPGIQSMEIAPVMRHVKQAGARVDGDRLATAI